MFSSKLAVCYYTLCIPGALHCSDYRLYSVVYH